tara:strand:- start:2604 stop:3758 length:1155 start_codon:yes stop_codon:yes gene_type:complete
MQNQQVDYIVLGGGCSALSLANQIIDNNIDGYSFLILESRKKYTDDKSWCFWLEKDDNLKNLISKSWKSFSFSLKGTIIKHRSNKYYYKYIRSIEFYDKSVKKIKNSTNISLNLGEKVIKIISKKKKYLVCTNKKKYFAKNIIDTRPKQNIYLKHPFLFQSFLGYEIKVNKYKSNFNFAKIMDNMRVKHNNFFFDYILPMGLNKFLIEITSFSKNSISVNTLQSMLNSTIKANNFQNYKVIRKEYGVIPMGFIKENLRTNKKNYFYAGTLGGAVRPSSGYAFLRIQKWAIECANLLKNNKPLTSHQKEKVIIKKLDMLFLKILIKNLNIAPYIFFTFLKRIPTDSFIRFMNGNARNFDYIKIIYSMPKRIFLKTLVFKFEKNEK